VGSDGELEKVTFDAVLAFVCHTSYLGRVEYNTVDANPSSVFDAPSVLEATSLFCSCSLEVDEFLIDLEGEFGDVRSFRKEFEPPLWSYLLIPEAVSEM
jgi:hypothetical protein